MSALQKSGTLVWIADKLKQVAEAAEIAQNAADPATREQAAYDAATKLAEAVGIGIPLWFLDKALTKTGLDRVFDSLKKNKSFEEYLKDQVAKKNLRDFGLGNLAEWGLKELREWISRNGYLDPLFDLMTGRYRDAKNWLWPRDPIILDLDGDGLETVGLASNIYFDHDGDGVLTKTGWVGKDDALLVWDRNGNGSIDTGAELFGDFTPLPNGTLAPNGFAALAALDSNGDDTYLFGRSDGQDTVIDGDYTAGNSDTLRFKEGVALADVRKSRRWRGGECANDEMRRVAA